MLAALSEFDSCCFQCDVVSTLRETGTCERCHGPLSIRPAQYPDPALLLGPPASLWHFRALLPIPASLPFVTLGEGATPYIDAPALAHQLGVGGIGLKNEMANPTGSFKDRQIAVGITWARIRGHDTVVAVSSGNVAASAAAYSARAGMRAVLLMHGQASPAKIAQAQAYGATVIAVDNPSPRRVFDLGLEVCADRDWYHLSTAGMYAPWNVEGAKTIAYELYQQYQGNMPDWILAPVGGGGLLGGIWRGLLDLQAMGLLSNLPRLAGIQAEGCAPLVEAIENDWTFEEHLKHPWAHPHTLAGAIADDILFDGHTALPAIRKTWGSAIAVSDDEMAAAQLRLARIEGLLCELSTASAVPAITRLPLLDKDTRVCCIVSGSGLKDLGRLGDAAVPVPHVPASAAALDSILDLVPPARSHSG